MEKVIYGRISSSDQNNERQKKEGVKSFIDTCSGSIPFFERPKAKDLIKYLKTNPKSVVSVLAVDRLGRNTIDILTTVEWFKENNYTLRITNLGVDNSSPIFEMMVSLMGTLAQQERQTTKERCKQGIEIAKANGQYQGRKKGTKDSRDKIITKHSDIFKCLQMNMKVSEVANITKKTRATVYKVKSVM